MHPKWRQTDAHHGMKRKRCNGRCRTIRLVIVRRGVEKEDAAGLCLTKLLCFLDRPVRR